MHLLQRIEAYLKRSGTTATRFGRDVLGDPALVLQLRQGRRPRPRTAARIAAWLDRKQEQGE